MAGYGRDYRGGRGWFDRWFGGHGGGRGYDRGYRGGRGGYGRDYHVEGPGYRTGSDPNRQGHGAQFDAPHTRDYFNPGHFVDEAWGGAYSAGDAQYAGRRLFNPGNDPGRRGYGGRYDRPYRGDDPGYGWRRAFTRGYDRDW
ncbi:MAG TPA: hypothetical protein VHG51_12955 [Longimicrobiaceae bacterium]|nr:hypothetical protein [Longimicrobiaceae bacterium]